MKLSEYFIGGVTANTTDCKHYTMSAGPDLAGTGHTSQPPGAETVAAWGSALHTVTTRTTRLVSWWRWPARRCVEMKTFAASVRFLINKTSPWVDTLLSKHWQLSKPDSRNLWRQPGKKMKTQILRRPTVWLYLTYQRISLLWYLNIWMCWISWGTALPCL